MLACSTLRAIGFRVRVSSTRYTAPIAPSPSQLTILYRPATSVPCGICTDCSFVSSLDAAGVGDSPELIATDYQAARRGPRWDGVRRSQLCESLWRRTVPTSQDGDLATGEGR